MSQALQTTTVTAEATVLVPRGTGSALGVAARDVLGTVDGVHTVTNVRNRGFRPRATDVRVDITAQVMLDAPPDPDRIADLLADGFGVRAVTVTAVGDE